MPALKNFINLLTQELEPLYGAREARSVALRLIEDVCKLSKYACITNPDTEIEERYFPVLEAAAEDLKRGRPLQYVTGVQEFFGREFKVREGVLIPRPETEELVLMVKNYVQSMAPAGQAQGSGKGLRILDAACGSGCIGISLACELPGSEVYMCDISEPALQVTGENINSLCGQKAGNDSAVIAPEVFYGNLLGSASEQNKINAGSLNILVSNPPYIRQSERELMHKNVLDYEPEGALFVPDENPLLFYKALAEWGLYLLKPGGRLFLEINEALGSETAKILSDNGYTEISVNRDLNDRERMVAALRP